MESVSHIYAEHVLSYGGGVNSTALAIRLINEGWHGPIVFADTSAEWPDTYCFIDYFERQWLIPRGQRIERLDGDWIEPSMRPGLIEYCESAAKIPLAAIRWCTMSYKVRPLYRWIKQHGYEPDHRLIGIAADEAHRQKGRICPLIDWGVDRAGCVAIIQAEGLDVPRKSGCYICPFQRSSQWRELWQRWPELYARAERLEASVQRTIEGRVRATLDPSGKLTLADRRRIFEAQDRLLDDLMMDGLLAYKPCECGL